MPLVVKRKKPHLALTAYSAIDSIPNINLRLKKTKPKSKKKNKKKRKLSLPMSAER
jgi:hypothetical protein